MRRGFGTWLIVIGIVLFFFALIYTAVAIANNDPFYLCDPARNDRGLGGHIVSSTLTWLPLGIRCSYEGSSTGPYDVQADLGTLPAISGLLLIAVGVFIRTRHLSR
jgi:hypothetical protein